MAVTTHYPELSFTLTPDELDRVLRYSLEFIGMGVLANAVMTLDFDNLAVYALHNSDSISFTYTKRAINEISEDN